MATEQKPAPIVEGAYGMGHPCTRSSIRLSATDDELLAAKDLASFEQFHRRYFERCSRSLPVARPIPSRRRT
jgi:hypothetical protein